MSFILKGNLCGRMLRNYREVLSNVLVKVYLPQTFGDSHDKAFTKNKYGFKVLGERTIASKKKYLVGEGKTDAAGNYQIELSDTYKEGSLEIDIEVTEVPHQKKKLDKKVQCTAKIVQPVWRRADGYQYYSWNYSFPFAVWGRIRSLFDAWVIHGHIKFSRNGPSSLDGLIVTAFDLDWIKDDILGTAEVDNSGYFRIDYCSSDYKKTFLSPIVNLDTPLSVIPGPGLYFKVMGKDGVLLYEEKSAVGKTAERRNLPKCFYVELDIDMVPNKLVSTRK